MGPLCGPLPGSSQRQPLVESDKDAQLQAFLDAALRYMVVSVDAEQVQKYLRKPKNAAPVILPTSPWSFISL